jgi:hypothetical protein
MINRLVILSTGTIYSSVGGLQLLKLLRELVHKRHLADLQRNNGPCINADDSVLLYLSNTKAGAPAVGSHIAPSALEADIINTSLA